MKFLASLPLYARQFIKFSIVGFGNFLLDAGLYTVLRLLGFFPELAKGFSFIVAATSSYYFNRRWTFQSKDNRIISQYSKFLIVATIGLFINTGSFAFWFRVIKLPEVYSFIGAAAVAMFWNFSANKFWTFKDRSGKL